MRPRQALCNQFTSQAAKFLLNFCAPIRSHKGLSHTHRAERTAGASVPSMVCVGVCGCVEGISRYSLYRFRTCMPETPMYLCDFGSLPPDSQPFPLDSSPDLTQDGRGTTL